MRRHLERSQLEQPEAPRGPVGRIELVDAELGAMRVPGHIDEQIAQHPVHQPRRRRYTRRRQLLESQLQLIERIVPRLIYARRLRGRAEEQTGEQVRQRRMVVPVGNQAAQHIRASQKGRVPSRRTAQHEVIAAAGAGMPAVEHELLGGQARLMRGLIQMSGARSQLLPAMRGMNVDFDDARIGSHAKALQPRIARRLISFHDHGMGKGARGSFDCAHQLEIVLETFGRRHEDIQHTVAWLSAHRRVRDPSSRLVCLWSSRGNAIAVIGRAGALAPPGLGGTQLLADLNCARQRRENLRGIGGMYERVVGRRGPRQRIQRQAISQGRIPGEQITAFAAQKP